MQKKMKEFRGMSDEQLSLALKDTEKHLFQLRFQSATDRLETPSEIRKAKRDIARIKTLQREKELAKLEGLPVDQLGTRIAALAAKEAANVPGKRTAHRQGARLTRFYAAKGGTLPVAPPPPPAAPVPVAAAPAKPEVKTDAKKPDAKKADAKKPGAAKGSGK
ncbi:50S ribosomal protein L29 [Frigoriglobus tundricola]|uniref:Large ribosomal subunit protein uL29 n=1 Tax=Frigoriglobus tundricola TaxID=2774151 RepID=A0A6M5YVV6_9BACT|nr:50S ribosomal protein L29 [Frigoriglobus tundricola]QJW97526.1 LSU ribosomal protein L29p (L35e) [Frigoriglobus tundricola]